MRNSQPVNSRPTPSASATLSRRDFLRLAGAAAAGVALAGCEVPLTRPAAQTSEKVQLVYQDWRTDWFPLMVQAMLEKFHATHPNIRVFFIPDPESAEFGEKKLADFQAGSAPDVFQGCCTFFPAWAQKGYTLDLRPYVSADLDRATIEDWDPAQYKAFFTKEGVQYGLPKYHGALALYYNKDLFDQYGVEYPNSTWDHADYQQAMLRLAHDRDGDGQTDLWGSMIDVSWDRIQIHVNGWGGHLVDPADDRRCRMGDPEAISALEWLRARIWDDRAMATMQMVQKAGTPDAFVNGRAAMSEDGSWALKDILSRAKFRIGIAPFPAGPVRKVTLATTDGFGIYAGTKHPDAAWEFLKFLISQDYGRAMARANFLQPARASLVGDWINYIRQEYPGPTQDMEIASFAEGHLKGYSVIAEISANMDDAQRIANTAWDQILTLGQSPAQRIADACRQIQTVQEGSK
jgi:multiple sugar transport system substrate-binding protein